MRQPELIAYGFDDSAAAHLAAWAMPRSVRVRGVQSRDACINVLREGFARAIVLRVGRDLPLELELLAAVFSGLPEVAALVVEESDHPDLRATLWDLGARLVASPRAMPLVLETLAKVFSPASAAQ